MRRNASTAAECICPTALCNRSIGREFWAQVIARIGRIHRIPGQVGPDKGHLCHKEFTYFGCFLSRPGAFSYAGGKRGGGDFPNCTALNHAE